MKLLESLGRFRDVPFPAEPAPEFRYYFLNHFYSHGDGTLLYAMLRHLEPARVVEVGSGFSSALMLDVNERFFGGRMECTFIEPQPERLLELLRPDDRYELLRQPVQEVALDRFELLGPDDVLLIDSSHVSAPGSDVNLLVSEVLPRLRPGVMVHFHDVFYPFEYPPQWAERAWSEAHLLKAFLQFNPAFSIKLFADFLGQFHREAIAQHLPVMLINARGEVSSPRRRHFAASIWLRRTEYERHR